MKTIRLLMILSTLFCFASCEPDDYRDKYVGDYEYEIDYYYPTYVWHDSLQTWMLQWYDSIYSYSGYIQKSTNYDDRLLVHWGTETLFSINGTRFTKTNELVVDANGNLSYPEYYGGPYTTFGNHPSYIKNDTIRFDICSGGLGGYSDWTVVGVKQD